MHLDMMNERLQVCSLLQTRYYRILFSKGTRLPTRVWMESVYNCSSDEFAYSRGLIEFKEHLYR